jgi:hypothetical protein
MFKQTTKGFWKDQIHQRQFFEWAAPKLGISRMEDWYGVSSTKIDQLGGMSESNFLLPPRNLFHSITIFFYSGAGLLQSHDDSLVSALRTAFPQHAWVPWQFSHAPRKFWRDSNNQRAYFLWAAHELSIDHPHGWYKVSSRQLLKLFGGDLLRLYGGSLQDALLSVFPEHQFDRNRFFAGASSASKKQVSGSDPLPLQD